MGAIFQTPVVFELFMSSDLSKLAPVLGLLLLLWTVCNTTARSAATEIAVNNVMLHDICSQNPYGPKRYFLDEGENGTIIAKNLDYDRIISISARTYYATFYGQQQTVGNTGNRVCSVELTTCPSCSIQIQFKILNLPSCEINANTTNNNRCSGCDHLTIKENFYSTPWLVCGRSAKLPQVRSQDYYHSVGRTVTISFSFSRSYEYAFLLEFASVVNTRLISARSGDTGVISSPHFPTVYPQEYSNEVKLQNLDFDNSSSYGGSIMLLFDDYALGLSSFIEVNDGNDTRQYALGSALFRPPVVLIQGSQLYIRFFANGARASGYRATYKFINESADMIETPLTDCGGLVDDYGGVITMNNMSSPTAAKLFDCIWLIKPLPDYQQNPKSHLLVRMEQFSSTERGTTLDIRQGLTSLSPLIETLTSDIINNPQTLTTEYLVPADVGFYIRLRGRLSNEFKMAIAYAAFSYTECYSMKDFVCLNHRCISTDLRCDGFNHCGDDSDEQTACGNKGLSPQDPSWWMTHTPKYYFPKIIDYGDFGATSFVLLVATLGVVLFIASILALLYRMSSHAQLMRERQARLEFVRSQLINNPEEREVEVENPPSYEAPPDYAEIVKLAELEKEGVIPYVDGERGLVVPTPTPGNKRRRELIRQARAQLVPGDVISTPGSSRASTPARSRHSTPQRHRARRTPVPIVTPVHGNLLQASDALIPNSPPPPYEINLDSPFHVVRLVDNNTAVPNDSSDDPSLDIHEIQILPTVADCGCPGACGCGPPSLNTSVDSTAPLLQPHLFESKELDFQIELPHVNDDSDKEFQDPPTQTAQQVLPKIKCTEAVNHRLARSFFSVDRVHAPTLGKLKDFPWNKSL